MLLRLFAENGYKIMQGVKFFLSVVLPLTLAACEKVDTTGTGSEASDANVPELKEVARILSSIPIGGGQVSEVYDAVTSSSGNGYDEEYTLRNLFASPGRGVGETETKSREAASYTRPLRELIKEYVSGEGFSPGFGTRAGKMSPEEYLSYLESSDIQIYWPYSENWDGESYPVITFNPDDGSEVNTGYALSDSAGARVVKEVEVNEEMAKTRPVWVVNRNDDSGYSSLEMLRRQDPDWGISGGSVTVRPKTRSSTVKTLILKDFTAKRNYDPWFAGASEFFVKCGSVESFSASTEAELRLYKPSITDFMIVVKRRDVGRKLPFNAVLISEWTEQLDNCAFMIVEDDGGTKTSWNCEASVKIKSKSYGFEISIPINSRDDIVWRGLLSRKYMEKYSGKKGSFGDVLLTFEIAEL